MVDFSQSSSRLGGPRMVQLHTLSASAGWISKSVNQNNQRVKIDLLHSTRYRVVILHGQAV